MDTFLLVFLVLSVMLNIFLVSMLKSGGNAMQDATKLLREAHQSVTYWKLLAQRFESLVHAKEYVKAVFKGIDVTAEHPDPAQQIEANKMIANLKRLADKVKLADSLKTKGSDETN